MLRKKKTRFKQKNDATKTRDRRLSVAMLTSKTRENSEQFKQPQTPARLKNMLSRQERRKLEEQHKILWVSDLALYSLPLKNTKLFKKRIQ